MRAITINDDSSLSHTTVPDPELGAGEVLIDVVAAGINNADILQRRGGYQPPAGAPHILGLEVSGTVRDMADDVTEFAIGDRVCALLAGGGYADVVAAPAGQVLPVPDNIDLIDAAGLPEAVCTAWSNLVELTDLAPGDTALIHGGSGGMGTIAIQLMHHFGVTSIATAGSAERVARCLDLGATHGLNYSAIDMTGGNYGATSGTTPSLSQRIRGLTDGRGVDVIMDVIGPDAFGQNLASLAKGGALMLVGMTSTKPADFDLRRLLAVNGTIKSVGLRSRPVAEKAALIADIRDRVWPWVTSGQVRPVVGAYLPMAAAALGQQLMTQGVTALKEADHAADDVTLADVVDEKVFGKVLLLR